MERHKARLTAEFTRARLRRQAGTVESLREQVTAKFLGGAAGYPRWVRVNALKTSIEEQLATTFAAFTRVLSVAPESSCASDISSLAFAKKASNLRIASPRNRKCVG